MESLTIKHPEWLQVEKDGRHSYGYNQEWYHDDWQRLAGCGPTTATQLISYVQFRDQILDPKSSADGEAVLKRMEEVFNYVKPRFGGGLYKTQWLEEGLQNYIKDKDLPYTVKMMGIYPFAVSRAPLSDVANFIKQGLGNDSPVAFLNRHRGREKELSTWHWVPIVKLTDDGDDVRCVVYDEEMAREFSLTKWLKDTILGGGFAYVQKSNATSKVV